MLYISMDFIFFLIAVEELQCARTKKLLYTWVFVQKDDK